MLAYPRVDSPAQTAARWPGSGRRDSGAPGLPNGSSSTATSPSGFKASSSSSSANRSWSPKRPDLDLTLTRDLAIVVAFLGTVVFWWLYFDQVARRSQQRLESAGEQRGKLARNAFTYMRIPMIAGVLVAAVADELAIAHPNGPVDGAVAAALVGGPILYLLGHVGFRPSRSRLQLRVAGRGL